MIFFPFKIFCLKKEIWINLYFFINQRILYYMFFYSRDLRLHRNNVQDLGV